MNISQAVTTCFQKYAAASGRASRSEYWYWTLFCVIMSLITQILDQVILGVPIESHALHPINVIFSLATLLPSVAVAIRRLHDVNRSGWWLLIGLTIIGLLFPLLYWNCKKGTDGENRFGPDPLT